LGVSVLVSEVVAAGVSSVGTAVSDVVASVVSGCSPFAMGVVVALSFVSFSLVSFLGFRPEKRLLRFFSFSGLVSDVTAGVSSLD
jgi:hypothetical protein